MGIAKASRIIITLCMFAVGGFLAAGPVYAQADTVDVSIADFAFDPAEVTIAVGTTVRWTNLDIIPHTSTSNDGLWDSGILGAGGTFLFTFTAVGEYGYFCAIHPEMEGTVLVTAVTDTPDDSDAELPEDFWLGPNYPNPFNPTTVIDYSLPTQSHVTVEVFNIVGSIVRVLVDEVQSAGVHTTLWDGTDQEGRPVASGVYFYRLQADEYSQTRRMLLLK